MQSYPQTHNADADFEPHGGAASTDIVAAGGGDNVAILGPVIDRMAPGIGGAMHAMAVIQAKAALGAAESLAIASKLRHGDDADGTTGWADYVPPPLDGDQGYGATTGIYSETLADASTSADGVAEGNVYKHGFDISGAGRYIRHSVTPNLSRGATDTATVSSVVMLGGRRAS